MGEHAQTYGNDVLPFRGEATPRRKNRITFLRNKNGPSNVFFLRQNELRGVVINGTQNTPNQARQHIAKWRSPLIIVFQT